MPEAPLHDTGSGFLPAGEGWFVVNARDALWGGQGPFGATSIFENPGGPWFPQLGIKLVVLEPGQPNCFYHSESQQEAFLVVAGECRLIVENEERALRAWDFFHCPAGTEHVFVGAGAGPCVILMTGARTPDEQLHYPVSALAARYGASVDEATSDPDEAYGRFGAPGLKRPADWDRLPWA